MKILLFGQCLGYKENTDFICCHSVEARDIYLARELAKLGNDVYVVYHGVPSPIFIPEWGIWKIDFPENIEIFDRVLIVEITGYRKFPRK